jgi:hypothetical protein
LVGIDACEMPSPQHPMPCRATRRSNMLSITSRPSGLPERTFPLDAIEPDYLPGDILFL